MKILVKSDSYWELEVLVRNGWGEDDYTEVRTYQTTDQFDKALSKLGYYEIPRDVRKVTKYNIKYEDNW